MNQDVSQPSFELPAPVHAGNEAEHASTPEMRPVQFEQAPPAPTPALPLGGVSAPPLPSTAPNVPAPQPVTSTPVSTPTVADDTDLIEKEWVVKAKQIVAATREDPYAQNREMSKFKADYLKKRYNKDIKLGES